MEIKDSKKIWYCPRCKSGENEVRVQPFPIGVRVEVKCNGCGGLWRGMFR